MRLRLRGQGRSHTAQSAGLPRPTHRGHDGEILRREDKQGKDIREDGHTVYELQLAFPALCHAQGWQRGARECRQDTLHPRRAELYAYRQCHL